MQRSIVFMDCDGSQSVPRSLGPLLNWLDSLHMQPHRQLNEDESKNNCQSPEKIELNTRPDFSTLPRDRRLDNAAEEGLNGLNPLLA